MSLLTVVQDVCAFVGVERPAAIFSALSTDRTASEMLATANEMAAETADYRDWTSFIAFHTLTGDGVSTSFPLPVDYRRLLIDGNIYTSMTPQTPLVFISSFDEWMRRIASNYWTFSGQYIIQGSNILIQPPPGVGVSINFAYVTSKIINNVSPQPTTQSDTFRSDDDTTVLDERLLKLGMIYRWKADKGTPYAEDMGTYIDALSVRAGRDKPSPILINRQPLSSAVRTSVAYPWPVPTP
jgi:hypothetical protein